MDPTEDVGVGEGDPTLLHHFDQISIAQFVGDVPAEAEHDNLIIEVPTFEVFPDFV